MFAITNMISTLATRVAALFKTVQVTRVLAVFMVGMITLTLGAQTNQRNTSLTNEIKDTIHQDDSIRPKTTGEWKAEARATEDAPLERSKRILEESGDALKDWAELYPDVAERTIPGVGDDTNNRR